MNILETSVVYKLIGAACDILDTLDAILDALIGGKLGGDLYASAGILYGSTVYKLISAPGGILGVPCGVLYGSIVYKVIGAPGGF